MLNKIKHCPVLLLNQTLREMKQKILLLAAALGCSALSFGQTARLQVIHNCADAVADSVDVYVDGTLLLDNFAFRTATPFSTVPASVPIRIGVAPKNSTSEADTIYSITPTLTSGDTYVAIANGIVSPSGYTPAPPFRLSVYAMGREMATNSANTDVLVMHGSTDAPPVDVSAGGNTIVDNLIFGTFIPNYLELPTNDYTINLTDSTGTTQIALYSAPLQSLSLQGGAIVVVASGFVDPSQNMNGPDFGLFAAATTGGALIPLQDVTSVADLNALSNSFKIWPNPTVSTITIDSKDLKGPVQVSVYSINGQLVKDYGTINSNNLSVTDLPSGTYMLQVLNDGKAGFQQFIKQ